MAKHYSEKAVADWSTNDFLAYLAERHLAAYGTEYTPPGRNWQVERGLIGGLIGTRGKNAKPRKYEPELVKAFIDECFRQHRCTPQWPGVTFTFFWKYKTTIWQRIIAESTKAKQRETKRAETPVNNDLIDWL